MSDSAHGDRLVHHGVFLLAMSQIANVANMAFHIVMGRTLGEAGADEYGILATMLNLLLVLSTPLDALRNAMAHFAARYEQSGDRAVVRALAVRWMYRMLAFGLPAGLLLFLASAPVAAFFHLPSALPVKVAGCLLPFLLGFPVLCGILQGLQAFVWMSMSMHMWGVIRLLSAFLLVTLVSASAMAGIVSHAIAQVFALLIGSVGVWQMTRGLDRRPAPTGVARYFLQALLMLAGYAVLMNSDVMLIRHFHPGETGHFAWAATIGRSVIFLPMPIALAMFPKVISMGASSAATRKTLWRALFMTVSLILLAVGAVWLLPWLPLKILYKVDAPTPEMVSLVRWVCLAMSPLGITYVLLHFEMAQHRFASVPWLLACAAGYIGGVALWHHSVGQVVLVMGSACAASALLFVIMLMRAHRPAAV